jgi:hypothetical protein
MLTSKGKSVLAKYLVNQAPGYAGYIAVGSGAHPTSNLTFYVNSASVSAPLATFRTNAAHNFIAGEKIFIDGVDNAYDGPYTIESVPNTTAFVINNFSATTTVTPVTNGTVSKNFATQTSLDFEMFRVPITSRAIVVESGETKIVFSGELPSNERYGISEIGIYPSGSNPVASGIDSRVLFNFSDTEKWEYHSDISEAPSSLIAGLGNSTTGEITVNATTHAVVGLASDPIFDIAARKDRNEQPRFETNTIFMRGNTSAINTAPTTSPWTIYSTTDPDNMSHIHHTDVSYNFDKNSSGDKLKLAFSLIPLTANATVFSNLNLSAIVQFSASENIATSEYANMQISMNNTSLTTNNYNSRYYVQTKNLSELSKTANFNWSEVDTVKIFVSVTKIVGTNISASVLTNNVATITTSTAHGLSTGTVVQISGRTGYNGLYTMTNTGATTFTVSITSANIASSGDDGGTVATLAGDYLVALDGLRFENTTSAEANPLYGLTGYSIMSQSAATLPIIKQPNTNNILEFKFSVDTGGV